MDKLRSNARALRNASTDAERHLWRHLRGRQLEGFRFRRQVPIAGYIADFVCPQARLIVELDGGQHLDQTAYDAQRTSALEALGYRVLRYWNDDVLLRVDDVVADIDRQLRVAFTPPQPSGPTGRSSSHESPPAVHKRDSSPPSLREMEGANSNNNNPEQSDEP